jgi:hypothetical protein
MSLFNTVKARVRDLVHARRRRRVFSQIMKDNVWESDESVSGPGSTMAYTENIRQKIPQLLKELEIKSMLDAPCGDYNWARHLSRKGVKYIGADIVSELIKKNSQHANESTSFRVLDIVADPLPAVDLWMCRDCLFHLPSADIRKVFANFKKSNVKYILTTSHFQATSNSDVGTGGFRLLNLELPPFSWPKPMLAIDDWITGYPPRILGLWRREDIP